MNGFDFFKKKPSKDQVDEPTHQSHGMTTATEEDEAASPFHSNYGGDFGDDFDEGFGGSFAAQCDDEFADLDLEKAHDEPVRCRCSGVPLASCILATIN
jgi:hypothetical protein